MKVRLTESQLKRIMLRMVEAAGAENERTDRYGNPIPRNGQGWGPDFDNPNMRNRQGYNADGTKGPWFSRSVACATAVLLHDSDSGKWFVLAGQRGTGTPDYQGYWNLPCGYLDFNEDTQEAAAREVHEETGINLTKDQLKYFGNSSSPYENRQNVCFFYVAILNDSMRNLPFSTADMEENEVSGLQWVPLENADNVMWAFGHDELIKKISAKYSRLINNEEAPTGVKNVIDKAINILETGGDTEYALKLLKSLTL